MKSDAYYSECNVKANQEMRTWHRIYATWQNCLNSLSCVKYIFSFIYDIAIFMLLTFLIRMLFSVLFFLQKIFYS